MWGVVQDASQVEQLGDVPVLNFTLTVYCSCLDNYLLVDEVLGFDGGLPKRPAEDFSGGLIFHNQFVDILPSQTSVKTQLNLSCLSAVRSITMCPSLDIDSSIRIDFYFLPFNWKADAGIYRECVNWL